METTTVTEYPEMIRKSLLKYIEHCNIRRPLSSKKTALEKMIRKHMLVSNKERLVNDDVTIQHFPRTAHRVNISKLSPEDKKKYYRQCKTIYLNVYDPDSDNYINPGDDYIPSDPIDECEDDGITYDDEYILNAALSYTVIKQDFNWHNKICLFHKKILMEYMNEHKLEEISIGDSRVMLQNKTSVRFVQSMMPLDVLKEYTVKTKSYSLNVVSAKTMAEAEKWYVESGKAALDHHERTKVLNVGTKVVKLGVLDDVLNPKKTKVVDADDI